MRARGPRPQHRPHQRFQHPLALRAPVPRRMPPPVRRSARQLRGRGWPRRRGGGCV